MSRGTIMVDVEMHVGVIFEDSRVGTLFLNSQSIRICRVSASRLKEFYCMSILPNINLCGFS